MARRLRPVELDFVDSAPLRLVFAREVSASPDAVYRALAEDVVGWPQWFSAVTLARPLDGGARREVRLKGGTRFLETIVAAEPGDVYAYRVDETNVPGIRAMVEEWRIEGVPGGGSRVRWTFAVDAGAGVRVGMKAGRGGLGRAFRGAVGALDRRLAAAPA
ncbi:SRPBCC family protein [Streptomyces sp. NBC_00006]|uniref:SRPBCC family protein n=1 Tax=unclassified Streptomyces TaxID=2593676 RepID=UPI002257B610|nr:MULTISPECIES: SRPBCC family protein [unclassified Streptomyces]MCX4830983.1 SRPBCC family protein [Streptomyces sp. NBC_01016]MCX5535506.1 SRPBCC family protein [Streptomyces sp. NBC_00006]